MNETRAYNKVYHQSILQECSEGKADLLYEYLDYIKFNIHQKHLNNVGDTEDIWSDACVKVYYGIKKGKFNPKKGSLSTWIYRVLRNSLYDALRRRKDLSKFIELDDISMDEDGMIMPKEIFNNDLNKEDEIIKIEVNRLIRLCVDSLKEKDRKIIELRYFQGLTYEGISEYLNIKLSSVKASLHRSKAKMKTFYLINQNN